MNPFQRKPRAWMFAALALLMQFPVIGAGQDRDPPSRVARVNYTEGPVSFQAGGENDWYSASHNRPLTIGDSVWTDRGGRAELHIGSTAIRLGPDSSLSFLDLEEDVAQLRLTQGSLMMRVRHLDRDDVLEVDTPNAAFTAVRPGQYRINVDPDGQMTVISVWHGEAEADGDGYSYRLSEGQSVRLTGLDSPRRDVYGLPDYDDFDNWAFGRDRREDAYPSRNYLSYDITGYEDLDDYGQWGQVSEYGNVWYPNNVPAGWAPYRYGRWAWIEPWGWTWIDDASWGFAPFHYGRWGYADSRWFWVPGPVTERPVYAPACVSFIGYGGQQFAGGPGVGWLPLAPGEVYVPYYRVSQGYVSRVNRTNTSVSVTRVTEVYNAVTRDNTSVSRINYRNARVLNGVTVVSRDTLVNARPVAENVVKADPKQLEQAQVTPTLKEQPARASFVGAAAPAKVKPPALVEQRKVVARRQPAPAPRPAAQAANPNRAPVAQPSSGVRVVHPSGPAVRAERSNGQPAGAPSASQRSAPPAKGNEPSASKPANPQPPAQNRSEPAPAREENPSRQQQQQEDRARQQQQQQQEERSRQQQQEERNRQQQQQQEDRIRQQQAERKGQQEQRAREQQQQEQRNRQLADERQRQATPPERPPEQRPPDQKPPKPPEKPPEQRPPDQKPPKPPEKPPEKRPPDQKPPKPPGKPAEKRPPDQKPPKPPEKPAEKPPSDEPPQ